MLRFHFHRQPYPDFSETLYQQTISAIPFHPNSCRKKYGMAQERTEAKSKRVMVAIDDGKESMYALSWALDYLIKGSLDTELVLIHAESAPVVFNPDGYLFAGDVEMSLQKYHRSTTDCIFEKAKEICRLKNMNCECVVGVGDPRDVICDHVEKLSPDVLVIGSHGYGAIKRAFLGSVSDFCAHNAKCPVLIVKSPRKHD